MQPTLVHLDAHIAFWRRLLELRAALQRGTPEVVGTKTRALAESQQQLDAEHAPDGHCHAFANLGLSDAELQVVWLLFAVRSDREVRSLLAQTSGEAAPDPTLDALRLTVFGRGASHDAYRILGADGVLRRLGIIERSDDRPAAHETQQTWALSQRLLSFLHGDPPRIERAAPATLCISGSASTAVVAAANTSSAVVVMSGPIASGRRTVLTGAYTTAGKQVHCIDSRRLPLELAAMTARLRDSALECRLTGRVPLLCNLDALADDKGERLAIVANEFAPLIGGSILVTCGMQRPNVTWDRPVVVIEMGQPTHAQRASLWHEALGQGTAEDADRLASTYPLAPGLIVRAAEAAKACAAGSELEVAHVYAGVRAVLDERLGAFAKRITVTQTWDDIVLPRDQIASILELMARVRGRDTVYEQWGFGAKVGRGLGVSALFSGPPGTGKTMVAGLIAKELRLELYQVDMAKVVSKFIGETEKNLAALFDAAEAGHAILLFDEADSLFGRRTEVKSSNDRYANLETNYLLQRLESFMGICLLTSNHETSMDPAFQRRLSLHLRFALPDADERAAMWQAVLPAGAPRQGAIDFAALGRKFAMSGGYIKNAVLRAAFLAADRGEAITAAHLECAARVEYEGMGKLAA